MFKYIADRDEAVAEQVLAADLCCLHFSSAPVASQLQHLRDPSILVMKATKDWEGDDCCSALT
jgi:hypothetical protein